MRFKSLLPTLCVLFLFAAGGCKKDSNNPVNTPTTISVNGFVKTANGTPINGVAIIINSNAPITTGTNGAFSFANVTIPYDLSMIIGSQKLAYIYKGLTTMSPLLAYPQGDTVRTATLTGTVPTVAGTTTLLVFASGTVSGSALITGGNYTMTVQWTGSTLSYSGQLYLLRWTTPASGALPTSFVGFGQKAVTISSGGSFANNFATGDLTDPSEQTISGSVVPPSSAYALMTREYSISFSGATSQTYFASESGNPLTNNFNFTVPNIPGATFGVYALCQQMISASSNRYAVSHKGGLTGGMSGVSVSVAMAAQLTTPVDNATGIDTSTSFLFSPGSASGGINVVNVFPNVSTNTRFVIYTSGTTFRLPNLSGLGLGLPSSGVYQWYVLGLHPLASVDAVVSSAFSSTFGTGDWGEEQSEVFHFTTKP